MTNETANAGVNQKKLKISIMGPVPDEKGIIIDELLKQNGYKELNITNLVKSMKLDKENKFSHSIALLPGGKPKEKGKQNQEKLDR